jgi:hypothetical protein
VIARRPEVRTGKVIKKNVRTLFEIMTCLVGITSRTKVASRPNPILTVPAPAGSCVDSLPARDRSNQPIGLDRLRHLCVALRWSTESTLCD